MRRPTIAVGLPPTERDALIQELTEAEFGSVILESVSELPAVLEAGLPVGLAVLDPTGEPEAFAETLRTLRADGLTVPILVVADTAQAEALGDGVALGPDDEIVVRPASPDGLRWRIEAMLIRAQMSTEQPDDAVLTHGPIEAEWAARSPIIVVFNPKGGVGKTTIATNLATSLQNHRHRRVLLIDADTVTGHVTMSLGMESGRTIADAWLDEEEGGPAEGILDYASVHQSGIRVVALVSSPLTMPHLDAERVAEAIVTARWGVDVIVVDLHPSYSEVNQAIFRIADKIIVPVTPDLPAIRAAVQLVEVATEMRVRERLAIVVNRANSGVSIKQIETAVGMPAVAQIRSGGMLFVRAANEGQTVTDMFPKEKVTADFDLLADRILGHEPTESVPSSAGEKSSLLGGIFGRKEAVRA